MRVIKNKQIIEDSWQHSVEGVPLHEGNTTVTLARWLAEKEQLLQHKGKIGLRLSSTDDLELISNDLAKMALIELNFAVFTDGRSFSMAKLLRDRYHYTGEIRATGKFMHDQINYLSRVGFNSFNLSDDNKLEGAIAAFDEFSVQYQ